MSKSSSWESFSYPGHKELGRIFLMAFKLEIETEIYLIF